MFAAVVDEAGRAAQASGGAAIIRGAREPGGGVDLLGMSGERHPAPGQLEHGEPFPRVGNALGDEITFQGSLPIVFRRAHRVAPNDLDHDGNIGRGRFVPRPPTKIFAVRQRVRRSAPLMHHVRVARAPNADTQWELDAAPFSASAFSARFVHSCAISSKIVFWCGSALRTIRLHSSANLRYVSDSPIIAASPRDPVFANWLPIPKHQ